MSETPDLAMIPSGYKEDVLYSAIPNVTKGDFDFARVSEASRINKEGLIEELKDDTPRITWELSDAGKPSNCPSLILENEVENLIPNSEDFTQASWTHTGIDAVANVYTAPDGTFTANTLTLNSSGQRYAYDNVTLVAGEDAFFSCFAKASNTGWFALALTDFAGPTTDEAIGTFDLINGVVGSTTLSVNVTPELFIEKYPNGWYRCILKLPNASSSGSWSARVYASCQGSTILSGAIGDNAIVWGAQVEVNNYLSTYIASSGGTTTRSAETCQDAGDTTILHSQAGVLYAEIKDHFDDTSAHVRSISVSDQTANNFVFIGFDATSNRIWGKVQVGGATQANLYYTTIDRTEYQKIAILWKENQVELWVNGEKRAEDLVASSFPADTLSACDFDLQAFANYEFYGYCKDLRVYNVFTMSATEITALLTEITS